MNNLLLIIITSFGSFLVGSIVGWNLHKTFIIHKIQMDSKLIIVGIITLMWVASVITEIANPALYSTPIYIHTLMGAAVGYVLYEKQPPKNLKQLFSK